MFVTFVFYKFYFFVFICLSTLLELLKCIFNMKPDVLNCVLPCTKDFSDSEATGMHDSPPLASVSSVSSGCSSQESSQNHF